MEAVLAYLDDRDEPSVVADRIEVKGGCVMWTTYIESPASTMTHFVPLTCLRKVELTEEDHDPLIAFD